MDSPIRRLTPEELKITRLNALCGQVLERQVDMAFLRGLLLTTSDNDQALQIQTEITQLEALTMILNRKISILEELTNGPPPNQP